MTDDFLDALRAQLAAQHHHAPWQSELSQLFWFMTIVLFLALAISIRHLLRP